VSNRKKKKAALHGEDRGAKYRLGKHRKLDIAFAKKGGFDLVPEFGANEADVEARSAVGREPVWGRSLKPSQKFPANQETNENKRPLSFKWQGDRRSVVGRKRTEISIRKLYCERVRLGY